MRVHPARPKHRRLQTCARARWPNVLAPTAPRTSNPSVTSRPSSTPRLPPPLDACRLAAGTSTCSTKPTSSRKGTSATVRSLCSTTGTSASWRCTPATSPSRSRASNSTTCAPNSSSMRLWTTRARTSPWVSTRPGLSPASTTSRAAGPASCHLPSQPLPPPRSPRLGSPSKTRRLTAPTPPTTSRTTTPPLSPGWAPSLMQASLPKSRRLPLRALPATPALRRARQRS